MLGWTSIRRHQREEECPHEERISAYKYEDDTNVQKRQKNKQRQNQKYHIRIHGLEHNSQPY